MSLALESLTMCEILRLDDMDEGHTPSVGELDDATLTSFAQTGRMEAFEELVRRYRNDVFGLAHHFVHNREDAWDLSQEVFIKAHRALRSFRGDASFKTWLMRITANQCKDFLKKRRVKTVPLEPVSESLATSSRLPDPGQAAVARETADAILDVLGTLPFKHRSVFILREFEDMSYEEMSRVLGCSLGTVMSRLHHARKKLREGLAQRGLLRRATI